MILQLNRKRFALNLGEDFEYINTYIKGKKGKQIVDNYRIHFRGLTTGNDILFFINSRGDNFFGRKNSYEINIIPFGYIKVSDDKTHLKFKNYNYYKLDADPSRVDEVLTAWKNSDPMVHIGDYEYQFITVIKGYTGAYKFNGKTY